MKQFRFVLNVHANVKHVSAIETVVLERQSGRASLIELCRCAEADQVRERFRRSNVFRCQVNACYVAAVGRSKIAGGPANPRPDIEQTHSGTQVHLRGDRFGGFAAANVEFVDEGEIVRRDAVARLTGRFERGKNALFEILRGVMLGDAGFGESIAGGHGRFPSLYANFICKTFHGVSHRLVVAERKIASMTFMLARASSSGTGTSLFWRMAREKASP